MPDPTASREPHRLGRLVPDRPEPRPIPPLDWAVRSQMPRQKLNLWINWKSCKHSKAQKPSGWLGAPLDHSKSLEWQVEGIPQCLTLTTPEAIEILTTMATEGLRPQVNYGLRRIKGSSLGCKVQSDLMRSALDGVLRLKVSQKRTA